MPRLFLLHSNDKPREAMASWSPPPYDLQRQPQRPGELCTEIRIARAPCTANVSSEAAHLGLPEALWATLAVEGGRVVAYVAETLEASATLLAAEFDKVSRRVVLGALAPTLQSRLAAYAAALRAARPAARTQAIGPILLRPSTTMLSAWNIAANRNEVTLEEWARGLLEPKGWNVVAWEAAAAFSGQTLAEWALAQAARRLRSRRTAPQTAA